MFALAGRRLSGNVQREYSMSYLTFKGTRVAPANLKWALRTSMAGLASFVVGLVALYIFKSQEVGVFGILAARLFAFLAIIVAVPGIVVPMAFLLAPLAIVLYGMFHDHEVWREWWFWCITFGLEVAGIFALQWYGRRYDEREL